TSVIVAPRPLASVPRLHVRASLTRAHVPCEGLTERKSTEAGSVSFTTTDDACAGPPFATAIEYVSVLPALIGSGASAIAIETSAAETTVVVAVAELFDASGSVVTPETVAVFVSVPGLDGVTTMSTDAAALPGRIPKSQL